MAKTILLTGGTSGIGKAAAIEFIKLGYNLILPVRDLQRGESLISQASGLGKGSISLYQCDFSSQQSLIDFVEEVKKTHTSIDILVNNAGLWNPKRKITNENIEETLAVNVFAPYFITKEFISLLEAGTDKRIVFTSSGLSRGVVHFDDIQFEKGYSGFLVYQQSKLAVILLTRYFAKMLKTKSINVNCLHPGMVNTNLGNAHNAFSRSFFKFFGLKPEKGAETLVHLAISEEVKNISGEYFVNKKIGVTSDYSKDMKNAEKLVEELEKIRIKL